nr:MAG TPA: hypothetical protein [Caudoviricetes sp.]
MIAGKSGFQNFFAIREWTKIEKFKLLIFRLM